LNPLPPPLHVLQEAEDEESPLIQKKNVHGKREVKSLGKLYKISEFVRLKLQTDFLSHLTAELPTKDGH